MLRGTGFQTLRMGTDNASMETSHSRLSLQICDFHRCYLVVALRLANIRDTLLIAKKIYNSVYSVMIVIAISSRAAQCAFQSTKALVHLTDPGTPSTSLSNLA